MVRVLNVYTISAFAALGGLLFGFEISSMSAVLGTDQYKNFYGNPLGARQGAITSAMAAGSLVGALCSSFLADRLSRKVAIQFGAILWCIGSALQSVSTGVRMLILGRIVAGLCIGLTTTIVPIYQSEIAPRKIRGRVVSLQYVAMTWGNLIQYFIQYGCSFLDSQAAFRLPWAIQSIPAILLFIGLFWFPFSPRWLASQNRWDETLQVLAFLRTPSCDINDPLVIAEYREIEDQIRTERQDGLHSFHELFGKKMIKRLYIAMAIQAWSQLGGINFLLYFIVYILGSAGIANTLLASSILYIVGLTATVPVMLWTDRWGRRSSLLFGAVSIAFWLYLSGGLFARFGEPNPVPNQAFTWVINNHPAAGRSIQVCLYLATASYAMSWAPVSWIYPPEIVPLRIRAKAVALATATNWAINFGLGFAIPVLFREINWRIFFIFGSLDMAAFIFVFLQVPETKQRTLEEMDEVFEHGEPPWRTGTHKSRLDDLAKEIERGRLET
ncbi:general substrate transporter [Lipomyces orientalis]|uniref:General substrate transporter n=1 Tax=Lipomyces orientalis TaxID=1233043 RepID=A0ACC3TJQ0_9ASCO